MTGDQPLAHPPPVVLNETRQIRSVDAKLFAMTVFAITNRVVECVYEYGTVESLDG